jgi:hypothetical protein
MLTKMEFGRHVLVKIHNTTFHMQQSYSMRTDRHKHYEPNGTYTKSHWGDPDVDGRIILRWTFRKLEGVVGTGWSWLRIGTGGGHL